jgi:hypothetical protein
VPAQGRFLAFRGQGWTGQLVGRESRVNHLTVNHWP